MLLLSRLNNASRLQTIVIEDSYCRAGCGKEVFSVDELFAYYDGPKMAETAFDYIKENEGLSTEKAYPFACSVSADKHSTFQSATNKKFIINCSRCN